MSQSTPDQLKLIDVRKPLLRVLLVVPVALALLLSWYALRWYVGNFVAEFSPRMEEGRLDAAQAAMNLAPDDPWTHWVVAGLKKKSFLPGDLNEAVRHYEEAVRLSPNDYRFWVDLGRTREEAGDPVGGEKALRRAVELAPAYAYPRWYLGNLLLRAGRGQEAFAELRRAAEADPKLRPQLFNVAWALYAGDVGEIKKVIGETPAARAEFIVYLVGRQRLDDALGVWSGLSAADKRAQTEAGETILRVLLQDRRFRAAFSVFTDMNPGADAHVSQVSNRGFEEDIDVRAGNPFSWQVTNDPQAQIAIDGTARHGGDRSLRIFFRAIGAFAFSNVRQTVAVEPGTQYRLDYFVRAENLKSGGTPFVIVQDAANNVTLGASDALPNGTFDWQPVTILFKTPANTEAVMLIIAREQCGADAVCPIFGTVWYDDFYLQAVGGAANPRDSRTGNKSGD